MKRFELLGRLVFDAENTPDAYQKLADHFAALALGQPVRSYTCPVCGYVEMYDASIVEPASTGTSGVGRVGISS